MKCLEGYHPCFFTGCQVLLIQPEELQLFINSQQAADLWKTDGSLTGTGARVDHWASPPTVDLL